MSKLFDKLCVESPGLAGDYPGTPGIHTELCKYCQVSPVFRCVAVTTATRTPYT